MQMESFYSGSGLFFKKSAVIFSDILESAETRDFILKNLELMANSGNSFIFREGKLNKPIVDAFKKALEKRSDIKGAQGPTLNIFELPKAKKEKFKEFKNF